MDWDPHELAKALRKMFGVKPYYPEEESQGMLKNMGRAAEDLVGNEYERGQEIQRLKGAFSGAKQQLLGDEEDGPGLEQGAKKYASKAEADADTGFAGPKEYPPAPEGIFPKPSDLPGFVKQDSPELLAEKARQPMPAPRKRNSFEAAQLDQPSEQPTILNRRGPAAMPAPEEGPDVEMGTPLDVDTSFQPVAKEVPEAPSNAADIEGGTVSNKALAATQNLKIGHVDHSGLAEAAAKERAPKDRSGYYAALKQIADSSYRMMGQTAPTHDYYTAKMGQEQAGQEAWRSQMAAALKQKFADAELDKRLGAQGAISQAQIDAANARAGAGEAGRNARTVAAQRAMDERARLDREAALERAKVMAGARMGTPEAPLKPAQVEQHVTQAMKEKPSSAGLAAAQRLSERLKDPKELGGWDTAGAWQKTVGKAPFIGGVVGEAGGQMIRGVMGGDDSKAVYQDSMTMLQEISKETSGLALSQQEIEKVQSRMGLFGSEEEFRRGMDNELKAVQEKVRDWYNSQAPQVKAQLDSRGVVPEFINMDLSVYVPPPRSNMGGTVDKISDMLKKRWGSESASKEDAVQAAKDMEDEEERRRYREENGLE